MCFATNSNVHERIADAYAEALVRKVKARVVAETIAKGAKVLTGGSRKGLFFEPTVITGVTPGMAAFDEERFGPVAVITTFRNDEEALALANATDYGLVAAVVSADLARAQRVADGLHSGACVASICTSAFKSGAVPACGGASSTILDEEHRLSRSVHSFFRAVRVFLSGLVDSCAFQEVSLGREVSIVFTSNGPLIYRWETHPVRPPGRTLSSSATATK
jgi:acyl-CoA reductase-like NAD-dependent aldehyde dehydrogenase